MIKISLNNYHQYIPQLTRDQKKVLRANPEVAHRIVRSSINKGRTFRCTGCNKLITDLSGYFEKLTCSDECSRRSKGHLRGKKRPEHSAHMKVKIRQLIDSGELWGETHRLNNRNHLLGVNAQLNKDLRSAARKSDSSKRRQLLNVVTKPFDYKQSSYFKKSSVSKLTAEDVGPMTTARVRRFMHEVNSIKSAHAMDVNPDMGATRFYKRVTMKGLTKCYRKRTVTVRSALEYNFVLWLEANSSKWAYEWHRIPYTKPGNLYAPDFKVQLGDVTWIVETKGFYSGPKSIRKEMKKMLVCAAWAREKGYRFALLSDREIGKRGLKVEPSTWVDLSKLSDAKILKFMKTKIPGGNKC